MAALGSLTADRAASMHEDAAERHEWSARYWEERGIPELAATERRFADNERQAAERERTRALGNPRTTEH